MIVLKAGLVKMAAFGTESVTESDLRWMFEKEAVTAFGSDVKLPDGPKQLYELILPFSRKKNLARVGFETGETSVNDLKAGEIKWPFAFFSQMDELLRILRIDGAVMKFAAGSATDEEVLQCSDNFNKSYNGKIEKDEYFGRPVKARLLLLLTRAPSIRLKAVLDGDINGINIQLLGNINDEECKNIWNDPIKGAEILPSMAARVLMLEPLVSERNILGVMTCEERLKPIPVEHKNSTDKRTVRIGRGIDTSGTSRIIKIGRKDLQRHWQIIGQTGTGKSTLLVTAITDAIKDGYGLTFFDPHGTTIDNVIRSLPEKYAHKVQVVRIGDEDNPVPISMWDSDDPVKEERKINDLCQLFGDIFNPKNEIVVGPRWERWFSIFAKAAIALFGKNASFESILTISQGKDTVLPLVYYSIYDRYPDIATTIKEEFIKRNASEYSDLNNWAVSKFQRIISVSQLRKTLGAGTNALDFKNSIDTDTVTLIDLASPAIGTHAARIVGTLLLMQLWSAVMTRKKRDMTHLVFIDEAHLFQTNPLPQMLAESRKFGLGIVLAHQHCAQMSEDVMDALDANSANFSAFRLSTKDARMAALRFDDDIFMHYMCKLDAFNAVTTLSVDGRQTKPFTLQVRKLPKQKDGERIAAEIEERSRQKLVEPNRNVRALTTKEIMNKLDEGEAAFYRKRGKVRDKDKNKDPEKINITTQDFPIITVNILKRAGITTIGQIQHMPLHELLAVRDLRRSNIEQILKKLNSWGIKPDWSKAYSEFLNGAHIKNFNIISSCYKTADMSAAEIDEATGIKQERLVQLIAGASPTFAEAAGLSLFTGRGMSSYAKEYMEDFTFREFNYPDNDSLRKAADSGILKEALFWASEDYIVNADGEFKFCYKGKVDMKGEVDGAALDKIRSCLLKHDMVDAAKRISDPESFYKKSKLSDAECSLETLEMYLTEKNTVWNPMPYLTGFFNGLDNADDKEYLLY